MNKNKQKITLSIDEKILDETKEIIGGFGGKVSPLVENLLKQFVENARLSSKSLVLSKKEQKKKLEEMKKQVDKQIKSLEGNK